MGKLDEQIKLLQRKKAKADLYQRIIDNLKKENEDLPEHPGLVQEVVLAVQGFCAKEISKIVEGSEAEATDADLVEEEEKIEAVQVPRKGSPVRRGLAKRQTQDPYEDPTVNEDDLDADAQAEAELNEQIARLQAGKPKKGIDKNLQGPPATPSKSRIIVNDERAFQDPVAFISKFREWQGKKVQLTDGVGNKVIGEVSGAAFPNLRVEVNGRQVIADPRNVKLV